MASAPTPKAEGALKTIGEVAAETGLQQHVLRYWETRFTQLRPLTRAGSRRYYRVDDVALVRRIDMLLNHEGYTVRGVQQLLTAEARRSGAPAATAPHDAVALTAIRASLADALTADEQG